METAVVVPPPNHVITPSTGDPFGNRPHAGVDAEERRGSDLGR